MIRWISHLLAGTTAARHFPPATLDAIQHSIAASEHQHLGEICFAVEGGLPIGEVLARRTPRERAHDVFARLRVWDTDNNTGVLVYILKYGFNCSAAYFVPAFFNLAAERHPLREPAPRRPSAPSAGDRS